MAAFCAADGLRLAIDNRPYPSSARLAYNRHSIAT